MPSYRPLDEPVAGYKLFELLGEGAFGQVWKAEAPGGVPVAIKVTAKLNGIHAIREWQSLQAVKHLTHPNLVNIHGVWLRDENGHVLSTDEVRAMIPAEAPTQEPPMPAAPPSARRSAGQQRLPKVDPMSSTLRCETLVVGDSASAVPPLDSPRSETSAAQSGTDSGTDPPSVSDTGSNDSAMTGSAGSGSAGSRARWARLGDSVPPLELITAMTLGDGTLLDRLRRCQAMGHKGIPRPELMSHLRDAVKGLQYLNDADVQHCDIKPENLLVVGGSVQVCDYGSALRSIYAAEARRLHADEGHAPAFAAPTARALTNQGYTVQYAAPEQLGAKRIKLHKTTDLYALATTYYALRTGKFPWSDDTDEPIEKLKFDEHFDFGALEKLNRYSFEAEALRRALRRDPKQRQQSVTEFFGELERAIGQEALAEAAARQRRKQIAGWSAVAVVLLMLVAAAFYYREELSGFTQQRTARDELSALLVKDDWEGAVQLVAEREELTVNEDETATTFKQLTDELDRHRADGDLALVQRATKLPDKLKTPQYQQYLVALLSGTGSPIGDDLAGSRPAAAAERVKALVPELPAGTSEPLQQKILDAWLALPRSSDPAMAAEQLVQMAEALPAVKQNVRQEFVSALKTGLVASKSQLDQGRGDHAALAQQAKRLGQAAAAFAGAAALASDAELRQLQHLADVLKLAALLHESAKDEHVADEALAVRNRIHANEASDSLELTQLDLIMTKALDDESLDLDRIQHLADLGKRREQFQATTAGWDGNLYRDLVNATLDKAAASLDEPGKELSDELLAALRTLPSEGSTDLRLAKSLVARASAGGKDSSAYARAGEWLKNTQSTQQNQLDARGYAALHQWHMLAGDRWWEAANMEATLDAVRDWRAGSDKVPLADEVAEQLWKDIATRAGLLAKDDPATFAAASARVQEKIDEIARSNKAELNEVQAALWRMSADMHAQRARIIARTSNTPAELVAAQNELTLLAEAEQALAAAGIKDQSQDVELAALTVECYLAARDPSSGTVAPPAVAAAWKQVQTALHTPVGAPAAWNRDYVGYVEELGLAAGLPRDPALAPADPSLAVKPDTDSPWFSTPLRRQAAASALVERAIKEMPHLPVSLKFHDEASGNQFSVAASTLEQARAWNDKDTATTGLLAVCRMYERSVPESWPAIDKLTSGAIADSKALAELDAREPKHLRMHVWLAHARAIAAGAGDDPELKTAAVAAYAEALRAGEFDPYGERGLFNSRETALACYDEIVAPARALCGSATDSLQGASRADAAWIYGVQGALLEADYSRQLASRFGFPNDPTGFLQATREAFAKAAELEDNPDLALRWIVGQARAIDFLRSRGSDQEQYAEAFNQLAASLHDNERYRPTFESNSLQSLVHHYRSRATPVTSAKVQALEQARESLTAALAAHEQHPRRRSPWCAGWLAQTYEELSRVSLERSWVAPWGKARQEQLQKSVDYALQAEEIKDFRLFPASCRFCAGNAREDFALYLGCDSHLADAEQDFRVAVDLAQSDPVWQLKANVNLGRVMIKRAMNDLRGKGKEEDRRRYRDEAIELLTSAREQLRSPRLAEPSLAREADFYLAEARRSLFATPSPSGGFEVDVEKLVAAEQGFRALASEPGVSVPDSLMYVAEAAFCARDLAALKAEAPRRASHVERCRQDADRLGKLLAAHNDPIRRPELVKLRFWLLDPAANDPSKFADKLAIAQSHLAALATLDEQGAIVARKKIGVMLGMAPSTKEQFEARAKTLQGCRDALSGAAATLEPAVREESLIEVATAEQALNITRARQESQPVRVQYAKLALDKAEEVVERAQRMESEHQVTLECKPGTMPPDVRQRFNIERMHLPARVFAVDAMAAVDTLANPATKQEIQARVRKLWTLTREGREVRLDSIKPASGGPSDNQVQKFNTFVGWN